MEYSGFSGIKESSTMNCPYYKSCAIVEFLSSKGLSAMSGEQKLKNAGLDVIYFDANRNPGCKILDVYNSEKTSSENAVTEEAPEIGCAYLLELGADLILQKMLERLQKTS